MSFEQKYQYIVNTVISGKYKDIIPTDQGLYIIYLNNTIEFIPYDDKSKDIYTNIALYLLKSKANNICYLSTKQKVIKHYVKHIQKWFYKDHDFMDLLDCVSVKKSPSGKNKKKQKYTVKLAYDEKNKLTKEIITVKLQYLVEHNLISKNLIETILNNFIRTFNTDYCTLNDKKKQIKNFIKGYFIKEIRRYINMKVQMKNTWLI